MKKFTKKEALQKIDYLLSVAKEVLDNERYKDSAQHYLFIAKFLHSWDKVVIKNPEKKKDIKKKEEREIKPVAVVPIQEPIK